MTTVRFMSAAVAFLVAAASVVPSAAGAADNECNKGCATLEKAPPMQFAECKDDCAQESDFKLVMQDLDACNSACEAKGGGTVEVGNCMEACTAKLDVAAAVVATRSCYRKCAVDPAGVKPCEARCDATADKALDACFKKCAAEAGTDVARVLACDVACPFGAVAAQVWLKKAAS